MRHNFSLFGKMLNWGGGAACAAVKNSLNNRKNQPHSRRLSLESLEERALLAVVAGPELAAALEPAASMSLIQNSDFESGNMGFYTDYVESYDLDDEGHYYVAANPHDHHGDWISIGDHTSGSGLMMLVNGTTDSNQVVWSQNISVTANTNYEISVWTTALLESGRYSAVLQFYANGAAIGGSLTTPAGGQWGQLSATWNSGSATTLTLQVMNSQTAGVGNDFALDDFSMLPILKTPENLAIAVQDTSVTVTWNTVENANQYILEYADNADFTDAQTKTLSVNSAEVTGLIQNTKYYFRVKAQDITGASLDSEYSTASAITALVVTTYEDIVDDTDDYLSLREAISTAIEGGTILFAADLSGKTITLTQGEFSINKGLTIDASSLWNTEEDIPCITINADSKSRVFNISGGTEETPVQLIGLTITGGSADNGGGIYAANVLELTNVYVTKCMSAGNGGGIFVKGTLTINGGGIIENTNLKTSGDMYARGGGIYCAGTLNMTHCSVKSNINQSTYYQNEIRTYGGGIYVEGKAVISDSEFSDNIAVNESGSPDTIGGGIAASNLTLNNSIVSNNRLQSTARGYDTCQSGGGIHCDQGVITGCVITDNVIAPSNGNSGSSIKGGGIYSTGEVTIINSTIAGNKITPTSNAGSLQGAGVFDNNSVKIYNSIIAQNYISTEVSDIYGTSNLYGYGVLSSNSIWQESENCILVDNNLSLFMNEEKGDYTLAPFSQATDVGINKYVVTETDLTGKERIYNNTVDFGAYESQLPLDTLGTPLNLKSSVSAPKIQLSWKPSNNASQYLVVYSTNEDFSDSVSVTTTEAVITLTNLKNLTTYYFKVQAQDTTETYKNSEFSEIGSFTTLLSHIIVNSSDDIVDDTDDLITLREAISQIDEGGRITFDTKLSGETITLTQGEFSINKGLTIDASSLWNTEGDIPGITINADSKSRVFNISGGTEEMPVQLIGLTITGGSADNGGGIYASGALTLIRSKILSNTVTCNGGGIYFDSDKVLTIVDSEISDNIATYNGGGICTLGSLTMTNSCVSNNKIETRAVIRGAGICALTKGTLTLTSCLITGNILSSGNYTGTYDSYGAGIFTNRPATLDDCEISGNKVLSANSGQGGGIKSHNTLTLLNCRILSNTISATRADHGAGIHCTSTTNLVNCIISENSVANIYDEFYQQGGGICNEGTLTMTNCTVSYNSASKNGGGISTANGSANLNNCAIYGNKAAKSGGGIYATNKLTLTNVTLAGNSAANTGGLYSASTTSNALNIYNSIIFQNYASDFYAAANYVNQNSLIGLDPLFVESPVFDESGNLTNAETLDLHLSSSSWGIDRGDNTFVDAESVDLDKKPRIVQSWATEATVDLGAYEYQEKTDTPEAKSLVVTTADDILNPFDGLYSLREVIEYAKEGDTITFDSSLAGQTITLAGMELSINKGITIDASCLWNTEEDIPGITINADSKSRVFNISGGTEETPVQLIGLTITGGSADEGGGIQASGVLSLTNCVVTENESNNNGGGLSMTGKLTMTDCKVTNNKAALTGAGIAQWSANDLLTMTRCFVTGNVLSGRSSYDTKGAGIYTYSEAILTDCVISSNKCSGSSNSYGAGMRCNNKLTMTGCEIKDNSNYGSTIAYGGGIYCASSTTASLTDCIISGNSATNSSNSYYEQGGGIHSEGILVMTNCETSNNSANHGGGGISCGTSNSSLTMTHCVVKDNTAGRQGGGIYIYSNSATFIDGTISNNTSRYGGGVLVSSAKFTVSNSILSENTAMTTESSALAEGGAIAGWGTGSLTISNCEIINNTAYSLLGVSQGGGVLAGIPITIIQSLFTQNKAISKSSNNSLGGALCVNNNTTAKIKQSTFTDNSADKGGAVYINAQTADIYNTIIAENTANLTDNDIFIEDTAKTTINGYYTLSSFDGWTNKEETKVYDVSKPLFVSVKNGNYRLAKDSQAIDVGKNDYAIDAQSETLQKDLDGEARFVNEIVDMGAYEYCPGGAADLSVTGYDGIYDGAEHGVTLKGLAEGDVVTYSLDNENWGETPYVFSSVGSQTVYVRVVREDEFTWTDSAEIRITPKQLTISGTRVADKVYDGTTDAVVTAGTLSGVIAGESVSVTASGAFPSAQVGKYNVTVQYAIDGDDAANYLAPISETVTASITDPQKTPPTLTLAVADGKVNVSWTAVEDAAYYLLDYSQDEDFASSITVKTSETSYAASNLTSEKTYYFRVKASNSDYSNVETAVVPTPVKQTLTVTTLADTVDETDGVLSLREAIAQASTGDTIIFAQSLAAGTITLAGTQLEIDKGITIDASAIGGITIDANAQSRVFYITGGTNEMPVKLIDLTIQKGYDLYKGGGIYSYGSVILTNCVITNNISAVIEVESGITYYSVGKGGGIYADEATITLLNCTITKNIAGTNSYGGGIYSFGSSITLYNSIITQNKITDIFEDFNSGTIYGYNNLSSFNEWDNSDGNNLIYDSTKPLFTDAENGDYTLCAHSQAIDVGSNEYVTMTTDLAGNPRIVGGVVDMGAYEYQQIDAKILNAPANVKSAVSGTSVTITWNAVENADQYVVEYSSDESFAEYVGKIADGTSLTLSGFEVGSTYYFRVTAKDTSGVYRDSDPSETLNVKIPLPPLDAPTGVTLMADETDITVSWNAVENATVYVVYYSTDETFKTQSLKVSTSTSVTLSGFEHFKTYYFRIQARNPGYYPNSAYSETQSIMLIPETEKIGVSVVLSDSAPTAAACSKLEESISLAYRGDTVYAQVWMRNIDNSANGITGGYLDLSYSADAFTVQSVTSGAYYSTLSNYYMLESGKITLFGGMAEAGQISYGVNEWVLLGYVTMTVTGQGTTSIATSVPTKGGQEVAGFNLSRNLEGSLSSDAIKFGSRSIETRSAIPLEAPENLTVVSGGANRHLVTWDAVENASGYKLAYSVDQATWVTIDAAANSCLVSGLTYGANVFYKVMAQGDNYRWADSEYSESVSRYVCPMDIDGNGKINLTDFTILSQAWLTMEGESNYNPQADIDGNGLIGPSDFMFLSTNWLKSVTDPNLVYPAAKAATFADGDFVEELGTDLDIDWDVF